MLPPGTRVVVNVARMGAAPVWVDGVIASIQSARRTGDVDRYTIVPDSHVCLMTACHPASVREKHTDHIHVGG